MPHSIKGHPKQHKHFIGPKPSLPPPFCQTNKRSIKAGNERRLDMKKREGKKKAERRRRDFD